MNERKSYFIQTFRTNEVMIFWLLLLILIRFPLKFVEKTFEWNKYFFVMVFKIMSEMFEQMIQVVDCMMAISLVIVLILVIPELIDRIVKDSLLNWIYSVWMTYRIRKFLFNDANRVEKSIERRG